MRYRRNRLRRMRPQGIHRSAVGPGEGARQQDWRRTYYVVERACDGRMGLERARAYRVVWLARTGRVRAVGTAFHLLRAVGTRKGGGLVSSMDLRWRAAPTRRPVTATERAHTPRFRMRLPIHSLSYRSVGS